MALPYLVVPHAQKELLLFLLPRACPGAAAGRSGGPRRRPGWGMGLQSQTFLWHAEGKLILTRLRLRPPRANTRVHLARLHPFAVEFPNEIRKSAGRRRRRRGRSGKPRSFGGNLSAREGWVSFVRFRVRGPQMSPLRSPLGGTARSLDPLSGSGRETARAGLGEKGGDWQALGPRRTGQRSEGGSGQGFDIPRFTSTEHPDRRPGTQHRLGLCGLSKFPLLGNGALLWMSDRGLRGACDGLRTERLTRGQGQYGSS